MKIIKTKSGYEILIDDDDYRLVSQYKWHVYKDRNIYYATSKSNGARIKMHRLILNAQPGEIVDHIDGNGLNNQKSNLRICTVQENIRNMKAILGKSKYKGVSFKKNMKKWQANIGFNYKMLFIGYFQTQEQAAAAYDEVARALFGDYANLNFTDKQREDILSNMEIGKRERILEKKARFINLLV